MKPKYSLEILELLFEAYRRNERTSEGQSTRPLTERWLGLGTEAAYRPAIAAGLMVWVREEPTPRVVGWLRLTDAGAAALYSYREEFAAALQDRPASNLDHFNLAGALET